MIKVLRERQRADAVALADEVRKGHKLRMAEALQALATTRKEITRLTAAQKERTLERRRLLLEDAAQEKAGVVERSAVMVKHHQHKCKERHFAAHFGRQQNALSKQIVGAELGYRQRLIEADNKLETAQRRKESQRRMQSVKAQRNGIRMRARKARMVTEQALSVKAASHEMKVKEQLDSVKSEREARAQPKPDREAMTMTQVVSAQ
jgi:hypothetical protein